MAIKILQEKRHQAAWRKRRVIFNNDGDDAIGHVTARAGGLDGSGANAKPGTAEWFWAQRCCGLEGSHVDTIFYNSGGVFNKFVHDTKIGEVRTQSDGLWSGINYAQYLIRQGQDCIELTLDFCRRNGLEMFWSVRMNDIHDNWTPAQMSQYKKDHPELLLFKPEDIGKGRNRLVEPHMFATAVDYGRSEIRDRQFAIIEEVCQRYDIDGLEIDFMREPIFFRPTLEGRPVELQHLEIMTEFVRRVRNMTELVGNRRGRPILIACRIPSRVSSCTFIGLDIKRWLVDDLVDIVVSSIEFEPFTGPVRELVALGHQHNVPVYGNICQHLGPHWEALLPIEGWIGAAMNVWESGADGVYTFNLFDSRSKVFRTIGDPALMATMNKVYLVDNLPGQCRTKEHVIPQEGRLPLELPLGQMQSVILPVGDDVASQADKGIIDNVTLRIYVHNLTGSDQLEFRLNGHKIDTEIVYSSEGISPVVCSTFFLRSKVQPSMVRHGDNMFEMTLKKRCESAPGGPILTALQMPIRYKT